MSGHDLIQAERNRRMIADSLTSLLTQHALDPKRIWKRVQALEFVLQKHHGKVEKSKDFARRLKVNETRASKLIRDMEAALDAILKSKV